jgi:hypothetical protein
MGKSYYKAGGKMARRKGYYITPVHILLWAVLFIGLFNMLTFI